MGQLTVQAPQGDVAPVFQAAEESDFYLNNSQSFVIATLPTARVLTVRSPHPDLRDFTRAYSAGDKWLPRFDALRWNDPALGAVTFSWDDPIGVIQAAVLTEVIGFTSGEMISGSLYR